MQRHRFSPCPAQWVKGSSVAAATAWVAAAAWIQSVAQKLLYISCMTRKKRKGGREEIMMEGREEETI